MGDPGVCFELAEIEVVVEQLSGAGRRLGAEVSSSSGDGGGDGGVQSGEPGLPLPPSPVQYPDECVIDIGSSQALMECKHSTAFLFSPLTFP